MPASGSEGLVSRAREDLLAKSDRTLYRNLDGVRAIAALLVLAAHSLWGTAAFGATGVWLFFVLSGFLLFPTLPRRQEGHYLLRLAGFFVKRITRLIPLYYIALLVYSAKWHKELSWLVDHVLFLDAKTFFWTVKMEAIFYLLLPLIGLLAYLVPGRIAKFVALVLATVAYHFLVETPALITVTAAVTTMPLWLSPFMMGICASIIAPYISRTAGYVLLVAGSIGLAVLDLDLHAFLHLREVALGPSAGSPWSNVGLTSFVATLFVTGAAAVPPNAIFCNRIIRTAGVCGYSFYIWQVLVMQTLFGAEYYHDRSLYPPLVFCVTAVVTYFVSIFSFAVFEFPAMTYGHNLARRLVDRGLGLATPKAEAVGLGD
jgi:peptidoglycan/LPS O-acetylase OafA/YrhL